MNMDDPEIDRAASRKFHRNDPQFLQDIRDCARIMRQSGRSSFHPKDNETALFLSRRGTRISVSMIETMVREMTRTYLPDLALAKGLSPAQIRASGTRRAVSSLDAEKILVNVHGFDPEWAKRYIRKMQD